MNRLHSSSAALPRFSRKISTASHRQIVHIPEHSDIFAFGAASSIRDPLIHDVSWTVNEGEAWAVVSGAGSSGKSAVFKTLLGHTRIAPPSPESQIKWAESGGLYPFFSALGGDPYTCVAHVSFRQRSSGESGEFFDYTTRYGAMREAEDRVTLRDTLPHVEPARQPLFDALVDRMNLTSLLNLPMITLSNGQTRRSRIVKAILDQPELLLLDEPLTGLDPPSRKSLMDILQALHTKRCPRIIMGVRHGEDIPAWITHVLEIAGGRANIQSPSHMPAIPQKRHTDYIKPVAATPQGNRLLIDLQHGNVSYGDRKILQNINWQVKEGERWHLQGANGSGKTTLLALVTGDHPQSFIQKHLQLPTLHRKRIPSAHLRTLMGVASPEMYDAFPRRHPGMSVWEAIGTGFDGGFVPRTKGATSAQLKLETRRGAMRQWRVQRCWEVLECLGPAAWLRSDPSTPHSNLTRDFAQSGFSSLSPGEQRLVLLMRALIGKPPLVLLDEAWSGMDDAMIAAARQYLRGERADGKAGVGQDQAVIAISHWEEEVPWTGDEVKVLKL
ncbi:P-loop containing nucleoside triphosphate hydrolase protein [Panaeolus papilionaceus]|nr:P-loop containing nucleoside triphosphate hydrolase protein [Panaeolus papilionaceus]